MVLKLSPFPYSDVITDEMRKELDTGLFDAAVRKILGKSLLSLKLRFQPDLKTDFSQHLAIKASWPGALLLPNAAALFGSD
jgi:hypothetical protein